MREEEGGITFVYRGGMVSYVEALRGGSLHALDWNGAGFSPHSTTIPEIPQVRLNDYMDRSFAFNPCDRRSAAALALELRWVRCGRVRRPGL